MLRTAARTTTVAVGLAAVVVTGAGVATATAQLTGSVISACVAEKTGAVRIPTTGACRTGESKMEWNKQGPVGATGPAGNPVVGGFHVTSPVSGFAATEDPSRPVVVLGSVEVEVPAGGGYYLVASKAVVDIAERSWDACTYDDDFTTPDQVADDGQYAPVYASVNGDKAWPMVLGASGNDTLFGYAFLPEGKQEVTWQIRPFYCPNGVALVDPTVTVHSGVFQVQRAATFQ